MQAVDLNGDMNDFFTDEKRKIPKAHLNSICQFKQGKQACRYIALTVSGFSCVKKTLMKDMLDKKVQDEEMKARGDNCEGLGK